jgi:diguanylate cyclase (GGDEF)-like protein
VQTPYEICLARGESYKGAKGLLLLKSDGTEVAIQDSASPIRDYNQEIIGCVVVFRDVSQSRILEHQMNHQASHDALTSLVNRREFEVRLGHALKRIEKQPTDITVLYLDLDQFKIVNDTCGHPAGDELLRIISSVLRSKIRSQDTLARIGGDEFAALLVDCQVGKAVEIAEVMREAVKQFNFSWEGQYFSVGVSIGVVPLTETLDHISAVLSAADAACYAAKDGGRNRIHIYFPDDDVLVRRQGEMLWVSRIANAFEESRFVLVFQPIQAVDSTDQGYHFEILIRMRDEDGGMVSPDDFLPAAERYTLMPTLDRWVVRQTYKWLSNNPDILNGLSCCGINLSGRSLGDEYFLEFLLDQFKIYDIPKEKICFEITETAAIVNLNHAMNLIEVLKMHGCQFALDDFGAGLSSFTYLKNLPVDYVKIDGAFVKDMIDDPIDAAMVRSINEIGHIMKKKTVAEFVESDAIIETLTEMGVDYMQGYAISRDLSLSEFESYYGLLKK